MYCSVEVQTDGPWPTQHSVEIQTSEPWPTQQSSNINCENEVSELQADEDFEPDSSCDSQSEEESDFSESERYLIKFFPHMFLLLVMQRLVYL